MAENQKGKVMEEPEDDVETVQTSPGDPQKALRDVLGSRYEVINKLGSGAFGEVYRARDTVLGREVAIKRIKLDAFAEGSQLQEIKQRFLREAQVAAGLKHPNIVTTHDIVSTPEMSFIVLELIDGETLQSLVKREGRLGLTDTVELIAQVAAALDHAHQNQVVHRDVKPANIMIEPSGRVKVMDFGIAKVESGGNITATGHILGTPNYMSPEQARGVKVDGRSDLFSLGCILYECLTGEKPFRGENLTSILIRILTEEPPGIDFDALSLPPALRDVLARVMAKDPAMRFASGADLIDALRQVEGGAPAAGTMMGKPTLLPPPVPVTIRRFAVSDQKAFGSPPRKTAIWKLAAVAAFLVAGAVSILWGLGPKPGASRVPKNSKLIAEEDVGFVGRIFGKTPRLIITVPPSTRLSLSLETPLSSETAKPGDPFTADLSAPVRIDGVVAIPQGSKVLGHVSQATPAGRVEGRGELTLEFDRLRTADGEELPIEIKPFSMRARSTAKRDAGVIGGLAGVGALVGGVLAGKKGAAAGGAVGGAAGAGTVLATKGEEAILGEGSTLSIQLASAIRVHRSPDR